MDLVKKIEKGENIVSYLSKNSKACSRQGWKKIGRGVFGEVFLTPDGKVVKTKKYKKKKVADETECTYGDLKLKDNIDGGTLEYEDVILCKDPMYVEYIIQKLVGDLEPKCKNYLKTYGFHVCNDTTFFITEKADYSLTKFLPCLITESYKGDTGAKETIDAILFQIIYAIYGYQKTYAISHNDLYTDNIMLSNTPKEYRSAKAFEYFVNGDLFTIPYTPFIVKIIDFGEANKYSYPLVFNPKNIRETRNPKEFFRMFDLLFLLHSMFNIDFRIRENVKLREATEVTRALYEYAKDIKDLSVVKFAASEYEDTDVMPSTILNDVFSKYRGGSGVKSVVLGNL